MREGGTGLLSNSIYHPDTLEADFEYPTTAYTPHCSRQLYEQTADINRLREYVDRWVNWHRSGLRGLIDKRNRFQRFWLYVITTLNIIE